MASPTILYITSTQAVGFSPGKSGRLTVLPADASGDIGLSIEALLAAMPGRPKQIYVLTTEVWSQAVTVESRSFRRIDKSQIPQMLAFEAESFSGISASSARTSIALLDAGPLETTYWVSQIDSTRFAQAADAVAFNGGKLMGLAHPAGLPSPLVASSADWSRLEQWDDAMLVISRPVRSPITRRFLSEPETPIRSSAAARDFLSRSNVDAGSVVELLRQTGAAEGDLLSDIAADGALVGSAAPRSSDVIDLGHQDGLETFLAAWSKELRKPKNLPVILPVRPRASAQTKRTLGLAATAAAVLGIVAHHRLTSYQNESRVASLQTEIAELRQPIDQFASQQKQLADVEKELADTTDKVTRLQTQVVRYQGQLGIHRSRMARLLRTFGESRPRDLILSGVESDGNEIRVTGRSVQPESIIEFARSMGKRLEPMNLSLRVPRREALLATAEGGPYEFEYIITDGE